MTYVMFAHNLVRLVAPRRSLRLHRTASRRLITSKRTADDSSKPFWQRKYKGAGKSDVTTLQKYYVLLLKNMGTSTRQARMSVVERETLTSLSTFDVILSKAAEGRLQVAGGISFAIVFIGLPIVYGWTTSVRLAQIESSGSSIG